MTDNSISSGSDAETKSISASERAKNKKLPMIEMFGPTIQGEGGLIGSQTMFIRFGLCIEESQRVLMSDWTLKPIKDIQIGDYVMSCDLSQNIKRRIVPSKVSHVVNKGCKKVTKICSEDNTLLCTKEHEVYSYKGRSTNGKWREASTLENCKVPTIRIADESDDFWIGWLHGAFAGGGSIHKFKDTTWRMKLSCGDVEIRDKAHEILQNLGLDSHLIQHNPGNGKPLLPGVEVTNHAQVEAFRTLYLESEDTFDYMRGWLAGFFDTDGSWLSSGIKALEGSGQIWFWQNVEVNKWKYDRCLKYLTCCKFTYSLHKHQDSTIMNSKNNMGISVNKTTDFFTLCRGILVRKHPKILNMRWVTKTPIHVEDVSIDATVWDITTEHGNFFAEGMLVHNCDYACTACDSKHAVDPQLVQQHATWMTQKEIGDTLLQNMKDAQCDHIEWVSITGGNPCIHDLTYLVDYLNKVNMYISIETQGTKCPSWLEDCDQITVSPKSPGMGEKFDVEEFRNFLDACDVYTVLPKLQIKIVIFSAQDIEFAAAVFDIVSDYGDIPEDAYYLSIGNTCLPTYSDVEKNIDEDQKNNLVGNLLNEYNILSNLVMRDKRLSFAKILPQLHVLVWGNEQCR